MKKLLFAMASVVLLMITMLPSVLAADGSESLIPDFYTWAMLETSAGCLVATVAVTQFVKPIWPATIQVQYLSYIIALAILIAANLFMKSLTWETAGISVINAIVIALSANGAYNNFVKPIVAKKQEAKQTTGGDPDEDSTDGGAV